MKDILSDGKFEQYKLVQQFSLDPSGTKPLSKTKTLLEQGLSHGSMIYCRVEERDLLADDESDSSVEVISPPRETKISKPVNSAAGNPSEKPASIPVHHPKEPVIEILSSDDDCDIDKSKQKPSPVSRKRAVQKRAPSPTEIRTATKKSKSNSATQSSISEQSSSSSSIDFKIVSYNIW